MQRKNKEMPAVAASSVCCALLLSSLRSYAFPLSEKRILHSNSGTINVSPMNLMNLATAVPFHN